MKKVSISISALLIVILVFALNANASLIQNGDFETGDLTSWNYQGDVSISSASNPAIGLDGSFAILGASVTQGKAILYQDFDVTGLSKITISFNWAYEYSDNSRKNDKFFVIYKAYDDCIVDTIPLLSLVTDGTRRNPIDNFVYGFFSNTYDVSDFGESRIRFALKEAWEPNDSDYSTNSSAAIDNVSIEGVAPVPEPTTLLLLGAGLIGLAGFRRKRQ